MRMNRVELVSALHLAAKYLPATSAKLMTEAATRLDATSAALSEAISQRDVLAAENVRLKNAISCHAAGFTVCEACGEENISGNDDVCRALNETPATDRFVAEMKVSAIPDGWKLVPDRMYLEAGDIESICSQCGDGHENGYGEFTGAILWIGELSDDGKFKYGLNIASSECPEEGSVTVCEFVEQLREVGQ